MNMAECPCSKIYHCFFNLKKKRANLIYLKEVICLEIFSCDFEYTVVVMMGYTDSFSTIWYV